MGRSFLARRVLTIPSELRIHVEAWVRERHHREGACGPRRRDARLRQGPVRRRGLCVAALALERGDHLLMARRSSPAMSCAPNSRIKAAVSRVTRTMMAVASEP